MSDSGTLIKIKLILVHADKRNDDYSVEIQGVEYNTKDPRGSHGFDIELKAGVTEIELRSHYRSDPTDLKPQPTSKRNITNAVFQKSGNYYIRLKENNKDTTLQVSKIDPKSKKSIVVSAAHNLAEGNSQN